MIKSLREWFKGKTESAKAPLKGIRLGDVKVDRPPPDASIEQVRAFVVMAGANDWLTANAFAPELRRLAIDYNMRWRQP